MTPGVKMARVVAAHLGGYSALRMIEYLLSCSPCLEQLSLEGGTDSSTMSIVSSSLKYLSICNCWNLKKLTISAANLVFFQFNEPAPSTMDVALDSCFKNVPRLSKVTSNMSYLQSLMLDRHMHQTYYIQLEKLVLSDKVECYPFYLSSADHHFPPCLSGLKQLVLVVSLVAHGGYLFYVFWAIACPFYSGNYCFNYHFHLFGGIRMI